MSRNTGSTWKRSRRLDFSLSETGRELVKRPYAPGQHGKTRRVKLTNYGTQLREKQRIRDYYGLSEKQFVNLYKKAARKEGSAGENLLFALESRLDNLVYRMGFANTRRGARQLVNHGHVLVNGKKVDIPSYQVRPGDVIEINEKSKNQKSVVEALENRTNFVDFVEVDKDARKGTYTRLPERSELFQSQPINELLVVEFYNR